MTNTRVDDIEEIMRMAHALGEIGYRDLAGDANRQRIAVCRRLWREGINERILRMLWSYAQSCGNNPIRLFSWWMDRPSRTVAKVNEMREREGWARRVLDKVVADEKAQEKAGKLYNLDERRRVQ
jgi:hypothetical protein